MPSADYLAEQALDVARKAVRDLDDRTSGIDQVHIASAVDHLSTEDTAGFVVLMEQLVARHLLMAVQHIRGDEVLRDEG